MQRNIYVYSSGKAYSQSRIADTKEFTFGDGKLKYTHIYSGSVFFIGQEKVFDNNIPIWGMAYYGGFWMRVIELWMYIIF